MAIYLLNTQIKSPVSQIIRKLGYEKSEKYDNFQDLYDKKQHQKLINISFTGT